VSNLNVIKQLW